MGGHRLFVEGVVVERGRFARRCESRQVEIILHNPISVDCTLNEAIEVVGQFGLNEMQMNVVPVQPPTEYGVAFAQYHHQTQRQYEHLGLG